MFRYRINQIKTDIDVPADDLPKIVARKAGIRPAEISAWEIRRRSIDSRKKPHIQYVYTVDFVTSRKLKPGKINGLAEVDEAAEIIVPPEPGDGRLIGRPVVVGIGPCGLFAGLELAKNGYRPIIIERGPAMDGRALAVERFRKDRVLDPEANMLFGEGGAGTFSDGKIGTGIKDSLIRQVLTEFRDAGAGDDIMYLAKPHIGTDVLREVIVNIRNKIIALGGEVRFNTRLDSLILEDGQLTGITVSDFGNNGNTENISIISNFGNIGITENNSNISNTDTSDKSNICGSDSAAINSKAIEPHRYTIDTNALVLAVGHSARDTFGMINSAGLDMQQKPFSIGVRMEHPQSMIDASQYGEENAEYFAGDALAASEEPGMLPPADYRLSYKASNGRGVYSFCMCPGGEVVVCSTAEGELCVNGMSNRRRDSGTANSGILCDVRTEDFGSDDVLAGVRFQEKYERLAFENGGRDFTPPKCNMDEFLAFDLGSMKKPAEGNERARRVFASLPDFAAEALQEAVPDFARKIHGYDSPDAVVTAVETRSSSPVRIVRDQAGESNIKGIYPAGEGAGYAGGITSAACDGIRAAWHIIEKFQID